MIDINKIGKYKIGLSVSEIKEYIKLRTKTKTIGQMYKKFCKLAKINDDDLSNPMTLMYREDIEKYTDMLIKNKKEK